MRAFTGRKNRRRLVPGDSRAMNRCTAGPSSQSTGRIRTFRASSSCASDAIASAATGIGAHMAALPQTAAWKAARAACIRERGVAGAVVARSAASSRATRPFPARIAASSAVSSTTSRCARLPPRR